MSFNKGFNFPPGKFDPVLLDLFLYSLQILALIMDGIFKIKFSNCLLFFFPRKFLMSGNFSQPFH